MRWFGRNAWALICDDCQQAETPVGVRCAWCGDAIEAGDDGVLMPVLGGTHGDAAYHADCHLRGIVGGLNHQRGLCICCGGTAPPDPPNMTRRDAASAAVLCWRLSAASMPPDETAEADAKTPGT